MRSVTGARPFQGLTKQSRTLNSSRIAFKNSGDQALPLGLTLRKKSLNVVNLQCPDQQSRCSPNQFRNRSLVQGGFRHHTTTCSATSNPTAAASAAADGSEQGSSSKYLVLGALFAGWYLFNIWFNIFNKQVLKVFPFPITCTNLQFVVGSVLALLMWGLRLHKAPQVNKEVLVGILPLAVVHTLGNLLTNVSLGQVAVSFTHTIKAMEPFFSVALSAIFLGDIPSIPVLLTLIPIVGGVAAASLSEPTFNWGGFLSAMGSNLTFQSRNVLSKKLMIGKRSTLDNINLFSIITIMSTFLLAPVTLFTEGFKFTNSSMTAMGIIDPTAIVMKALVAGMCFHAYQQVSYMILQRVSPVTHSIGNCIKRVIVIVVSVIVFANPVTAQNAVGTGIALLGVFAYSQAKRLPAKKDK